MYQKQINKVYQQILEFESYMKENPDLHIHIEDFNSLSKALDKLYNCQSSLFQKIDEKSFEDFHKKQIENDIKNEVEPLIKNEELLTCNLNDIL